jgi:hypothetical protein
MASTVSCNSSLIPLCSISHLTLLIPYLASIFSDWQQFVDADDVECCRDRRESLRGHRAVDRDRERRTSPARVSAVVMSCPDELQ